MSAWNVIQYRKRVSEVSRRLEVLAHRIEEEDPTLAETLREMHHEIEDATDTLVFGRSIGRRHREMV